MGSDGVIDLSGKTSVKIKVSDTSYIEITSGKITIQSDVIEIKGTTSSSIEGASPAKALFSGNTIISGSQIVEN